MNTSDQANGPVPEQREQARKKPYHKPAVRHERVFEVSALTCGKVSSTQASCAHAIKKS